MKDVLSSHTVLEYEHPHGGRAHFLLNRPSVTLELVNHSIRLRKNVLWAKLGGRFSTLSWWNLLKLLPRSTNSWPREVFATPEGPSSVREGEPEGGFYQTPFGRLWAPHSERAAIGLTVLEMLGHPYEYMGVRINKGDVVLDLGTNLGIFTRFALNKGASRVVCFEANPVMTTSLKKTFQEEIASGRVMVIEAPVWSHVSKVRFSGEGLTGKISEDRGIELETVTVDDIAQQLKLERVDFIKADIEGAERYALQGAAHILARFVPKLALCVYHLTDDPEAISSVVKTAYPLYKTAFHDSGEFLYCW